jgi:hypothetical protein
MLRITRATSSNQEITLQLDGRVTGQSVELLRESAESVLNESPPRPQFFAWQLMFVTRHTARQDDVWSGLPRGG